MFKTTSPVPQINLSWAWCFLLWWTESIRLSKSEIFNTALNLSWLLSRSMTKSYKFCFLTLSQILPFLTIFIATSWAQAIIFNHLITIHFLNSLTMCFCLFSVCFYFLVTVHFFKVQIQWLSIVLRCRTKSLLWSTNLGWHASFLAPHPCDAPYSPLAMPLWQHSFTFLAHHGRHRKGPPEMFTA